MRNKLKAEKKTNAMRMLDTMGIAYRVLAYEFDEDDFDGRNVAGKVGLPPECVFKTLVAKSPKGRVAVCCVPVAGKLDLKALAALAGEKSLEMIHVGELLPLTGYMRGGCPPFAMKKKYDTFVDGSALLWDENAVSAGVRGWQLLLPPADLLAAAGAVTGKLAT